MKKMLFAALALAGIFGASSAQAQVGLDAYADAKGYIDVTALTCGQLANTWQEDANNLAIWYSGWYNGLAKKHYADLPRTKELEHLLIVYCKEHNDVKVIEALDKLFKAEREKVPD